MFEAKNYNDLRKTLVFANIVLAAGWLALIYAFVLLPRHKLAFQGVFSALKLDPFWGSIITISLIAGVWGFATTFLFRLHDRLYEPHLVSWRAAYETDFILRSLAVAYPQSVPERFFERAFDDETLRARCMQRLFYRFTGDSKTPHQELLERFYATIQNYWLVVLAEVYCLAFLIFAAVYSYFAGQASPPYRTWIAVLLAAIGLRIWSNHYLPKIRPITSEQVYVVLQEHRDEFNEAMEKLLAEYEK